MSPPISPSSPARRASLQPRACDLCSRRKVRCDRLTPCSNCVRYKALCIYHAPASRGPRKKHLHYAIGKIHSYERVEPMTNGSNGHAVVAGTGAGSLTGESSKWSTSPSRTDSQSQASPAAPVEGRLMVNRGRLRYLENNIWKSLSDEIHDPEAFLHDSTDEETEQGSSLNVPYSDPTSVLMSAPSSRRSLSSYHPSVVQARELWSIFVQNVDPLLKLFDIRRKEEHYMAALANLPNITRRDEVFSFAIYFIATNSIDDEECLQRLKEERCALLRRFQYGVQQALIASSLIKSSDLVVLQSFVLYLVAMRQRCDYGTFWTLTGVAVRIAQRGGLHRDSAALGASPWIVEMSRRLWYNINVLNTRSAELCGIGNSVPAPTWDTHLPLNLNDSDLQYAATDEFAPRIGATDISHCLMQYEISQFCIRQIRVHGQMAGDILSSDGLPESLARTDAAIDEIEKIVEQRFLRYCDPLVPLHYLTAITARSIICNLRLRTHHPRQYPDKGASLPQSEKDMIWNTANKILEYDNLAHSNPIIKRFKWGVQCQFPWRSLIYVLGELHIRLHGPEVDHAWDQVEETFLHYPKMFMRSKRKPLHVAISSLSIKAWDARAQYLKDNSNVNKQPTPPKFVTILTEQRSKPRSVPSVAQPRNSMPYDPVKPAVFESPGSLNGTEQYTASSSNSSSWMPYLQQVPQTSVNDDAILNVDPMALDWSHWDELLWQSSEMQSGAPIQHPFT